MNRIIHPTAAEYYFPSASGILTKVDHAIKKVSIYSNMLKSYTYCLTTTAIPENQ